MLRMTAYRFGADLLRLAALPFLVIGWVATPILSASAWCEDRAREWQPRLWDRDQDPRSDAEERRP